MRVEADNFILVLDVVKDHAFAVDGGKLGLARKRNGGDYLTRGGVNDGGVLAASVECPNGLCRRLEDDAVGISSGGDGGDRGQCGAIENDHCVAASIGDVAELARIVQSNAVSAVKTGDGSKRLTR